MNPELTLNAHNKGEFTLAQMATSDASSIVMYTTEDNNIQLDVKLDGETVWLSQQQMVLLFGRDKSVISRHIKNIFEEGELDKSLVCANFATPKKYRRQEGYEQIQYVDYYNLDVIISVGYRVKSVQGTLFRQWANRVLKDYLIKGYAVNRNITQQHYEELKNVFYLSLCSNKMKSIGPEIGEMTNLRILIIDMNHLRSLPKEIGKLTNLMYLEVGDNPIDSLPEEIKNLTQLQVLHIDNWQTSSQRFSGEYKKHLQELLPNCKIYFDKN